MFFYGNINLDPFFGNLNLPQFRKTSDAINFFPIMFTSRVMNGFEGTNIVALFCFA